LYPNKPTFSFVPRVFDFIS